MPELPEVETTCRGISPHIIDNPITSVIVREKRLRWPIPPQIKANLVSHTIQQVSRRAKYILLYTETRGNVIMHLGMSGFIRVLPTQQTPEKHDHFDMCFQDGCCLRFTDPRRFGAILWTKEDPLCHPLLNNLGPEPLSPSFNTDYLYDRSRTRKVSAKQFIMNANIVVGVGNIYASEALFAAGIHPNRLANRISYACYDKLVRSIKKILLAAIKKGGTTLKDFKNSDGKPGYFKQNLKVYGRKDQACFICEHKINAIVLGQRSTYYCPQCQH
jgi:formamidopyrimidine-DNA glycosylase